MNCFQTNENNLTKVRNMNDDLFLIFKHYIKSLQNIIVDKHIEGKNLLNFSLSYSRLFEGKSYLKEHQRNQQEKNCYRHSF